MFGPLHVIIIQTYLCRIAASVLRKKTAINAGPVIKSEQNFYFLRLIAFLSKPTLLTKWYLDNDVRCD